MAGWLDLKHTYNLKGKIIFSVIGIVCIALGASVCRMGNVGVDPFTAMNIGVADLLGLSLGVYQLIVNIIILVAVFFLDKMQIGLGTLINMVAVGFLIDFFTWAYGLLPNISHGFISSGVHLVIGTVLFTFGVSLYMKTRMGVSPIDAVAPIASERLPFTYTQCRVTQDILVTAIAFIAGGPIGVFTVIAAFFTGPLITFFNRFVTIPVYKRLSILDEEDLAEVTKKPKSYKKKANA